METKAQQEPHQHESAYDYVVQFVCMAGLLCLQPWHKQHDVKWAMTGFALLFLSAIIYFRKRCLRPSIDLFMLLPLMIPTLSGRFASETATCCVLMLIALALADRFWLKLPRAPVTGTSNLLTAIAFFTAARFIR